MSFIPHGLGIQVYYMLILLNWAGMNWQKTDWWFKTDPNENIAIPVSILNSKLNSLSAFIIQTPVLGRGLPRLLHPDPVLTLIGWSTWIWILLGLLPTTISPWFLLFARRCWSSSRRSISIGHVLHIPFSLLLRVLAELLQLNWPWKLVALVVHALLNFSSNSPCKQKGKINRTWLRIIISQSYINALLLAIFHSHSSYWQYPVVRHKFQHHSFHK